MSTAKRDRDTAPYLLSHFLNSKESLDCSWMTGNIVSILRYIYDVMEMTYKNTGACICNKSKSQIARYSRTSQTTVKRALRLFIQHNLLEFANKLPLSEQKNTRKPPVFCISNF